jgi:hypothetical protein
MRQRRETDVFWHLFCVAGSSLRAEACDDSYNVVLKPICGVKITVGSRLPRSRPGFRRATAALWRSGHPPDCVDYPELFPKIPDLLAIVPMIAAPGLSGVRHPARTFKTYFRHVRLADR